MQSSSKWSGAIIGLLTAASMFLGASLLASLVSIWPKVAGIADASAAGSARNSDVAEKVVFAFGIFSLRLDAGATLLVLVLLMGALGSFVHIATSLSDFVGNRAFKSSWIVWYLLRPFVGASLAVLLYVAFRGGLFNATAKASDINPYGLAALAGLSGLFSKQAADKLRELFETLFRVPPGTGDDQRADDLVARKPVLSRVDPSTVAAGATAQIQAYGASFDRGAVVRVNGTDVQTTFISTSQLAAVIPSTGTMTPGQALVAVFNPPPGGGVSDQLTLLVTT